MTSAVARVLGLSIILSVASACDGGGEEDATGGTGPIATGGSNTTGGTTSTGGSSVTAGTSAGGTGVVPEGVPLAPMMGWVDGASNTLGIQGALFSFADDTSKVDLVGDFTGTNACIKGTAAKVDLACTPVAPATDCYGTFWGAAIGLNLNQPMVPDPLDPTKMIGKQPPDPYDASAITGFAFEIEGATVPLPTAFRFKVENATGEFCTPPATGIKPGVNKYVFSDLIAECWKAGGATAETAKASLLKISWQVVTNDAATVPFDFCVKNIVALQ